jgi:hypothetical protein
MCANDITTIATLYMYLLCGYPDAKTDALSRRKYYTLRKDIQEVLESKTDRLRLNPFSEVSGSRQVHILNKRLVAIEAHHEAILQGIIR